MLDRDTRRLVDEPRSTRRTADADRRGARLARHDEVRSTWSACPPRRADPRRSCHDGRNVDVSAIPGGTGAPNAATRLGLAPRMVVQELGWGEDVDDDLRIAIEDTIDADMVDGDYGNVVDAVVLWWRDDDGDLVDSLVDSLTDLGPGGVIWLLTPKIGRINSVDASDVAEAAPIAGLAITTTAAVSRDWTATRLVAPKSPR